MIVGDLLGEIVRWHPVSLVLSLERHEAVVRRVVVQATLEELNLLLVIGREDAQMISGRVVLDAFILIVEVNHQSCWF